ncbi:MAG: hypothetical protein M5R36_28205 [Deltaproteobacteria bacterium]|nr:hypothetical protein [Deltaproteobacteria bacterium]
MPHVNAGCDEYKAIAKAQEPEGGITTPTHFVLERVPKVRGDIANPVVRRALMELRDVVNAIIDERGKPARVVLELGRDLKRTLKERDEYRYRQRQNEKERESAENDLSSQAGLIPDEIRGQSIRRARLFRHQRLDVKNFKEKDLKDCPPDFIALWKEQKHICPYSGHVISWTDLSANDGRLDIDHILPQSKTLDNSFLNTVLCFRHANAEKGNSTPYEWLVERKGRRDLYDGVRLRVKFMSMPSDKKKQFEIEHVNESEFNTRQLNDTRYASREARRLLERLFSKDDAARRLLLPAGKITADLRYHWEVSHIIADYHGREVEPKKLRDDLRHNALDAAVLACLTFKARDDLKHWYRDGERGIRRKERDRIRAPFDGFANRLRYLLFDKEQTIETPMGNFSVVGTIVSEVPDVSERGPLHSEQPYAVPKEYADEIAKNWPEGTNAVIGSQGRFAQKKRLVDLSMADIFRGYDPKTKRVDPAETIFAIRDSRG